MLLRAQVPDSLPPQVPTTGPVIDTSTTIDTIAWPPVDSFSRKPSNKPNWRPVDSLPFEPQMLRHIYLSHPYFGFGGPALNIKSDQKKFVGKEGEFYFILILLLLFAVFRQAFWKYFTDLFRLFFRRTLNQRQLREQLLATPLPSMLLNVFFVIIAGMYIAYVLWHFNLRPVDNFWLLFFYCMLGLSAIYFVKFIGLKLSGWLFNIREAMDGYIFVVFIINKMMAIYLLPFLVLLAFTSGTVYQVAFTLAWCGILALLAYRLILSYGAVRNQIKVNLFHFILYLLAFEVAPLLLIYKLLLRFF